MAKTKKQVVKQEETEHVLRVASYLRVSTDEQAESGLGLGAQEEKARAACTMKGWPMPTLYVDAGLTGKIDITERTRQTTEYPTGAQLVEDIRAGLIDVVIVSALDRIGRKAIYILNFISLLGERVQLFSAKETIDTSTPAGRFMVTILAGLAELERDTIAERTKAALEQRGREVGIKAGVSPYGYRYEGKNVLIVPEQAHIVRRVYALREQGLTLRAIASTIEQETGTRVAFKTVGLILDREDVYRGGLRGDSTETWPIILEKVLQIA